MDPHYDRLPIFLFGDQPTAEMVPPNVLGHHGGDHEVSRYVWVMSVLATARIGLAAEHTPEPARAQPLVAPYASTNAATAAAPTPDQPPVKDIDLEEGQTKTRPALFSFPRLGFGGSTDWTEH
jgi:hypothetical protein